MTAFQISIVSLVLACVALGWNIYRDVVLKARVVTRFAVVQILSAREGERPQAGKSYLRIMAVNHGPGPVHIESIDGQITPFWRSLIRRPRYFVILNDHENPMNPALPMRLDVGATVTLYLPYDERCFLDTDATHIGVGDSFARVHYAPRADVREGRRQFRKDFPESTGGTPIAHGRDLIG